MESKMDNTFLGSFLEISNYVVLIGSGLLVVISLIVEINKQRSNEDRKIIFGLTNEEKNLLSRLPITNKPILKSRNPKKSG